MQRYVVVPKIPKNVIRFNVNLMFLLLISYFDNSKIYFALIFELFPTKEL
jgi:hypothetical protein